MRERFGKAFTTLTIVIVIAAALFGGWKLKEWVENRGTAEVTSGFVEGKIEEISELTSAEMTYRGILKVSQGDIPFITRKGFSMLYTAEIKAGIDPSKVRVRVEMNEVVITIPKIEIISCNVDPASIEFYDNKYALFNWSKKEDVVEAEKAAVSDAEEKADIDGLRKKALENAENIIYEMVKDGVNGRRVLFSYEGNKDKTATEEAPIVSKEK